MDLSSNARVDLLYLTNPAFIDKYNKKNKPVKIVSDEDVKFYRKRIMSSTKDYLRGKNINSSITAAFENYAAKLIEYYKFVDKKEIVQKEYNSLPEKKTKSPKDFKLMEQNVLMMKTKENTVKTIKDYLPIVVKEKKNKKIIIPKKKQYDIKNPEYRVKGVNKKLVEK